MNFQGKPKKYLIIALKVIGWITLSIVAILILVSVGIQIPYVQNKLTQKAVSFLEKKIGTEVKLERISLSIPKKIVLTGLYLEDQQKDTLLYAGELAINTDLWKLTKQTIQLNDLELSEFKGTVTRSERDSAFNFDYIVEAFASDSTAAPDTTQAPWKFAVGDIILNDIRILFSDRLLGNELALQLRQLEIGMDEFDLEKSIVKVNDISLEGVKASILQSKVEPDTVVIVPDSAEQDVTFDVGINSIDLKNIEALYNHQGTGQILSLNLGELLVEANGMDLRNRSIDLSKISLENTFISFHQMAGFRRSAPKEDSSKTDEPNNQWVIALEQLDLSNNSLQYHNFEEPFQRGQFDSNHIWLTNFTASANDLEWSGETAKGDLDVFSFKDRSGFVVESFSANVEVNDTSATVSDFKFVSANTNLRFSAQAKYAALKDIASNYHDAIINLAISESVIGISDVRLFAPAVLDSLPITVPENAQVSIATEMKGPLKDLDIGHLVVRTLGGTELKTRGNIQLRKGQDPRADITLDKFYTTKKDVTTLLPDTLIPASIAVPDWVNISGNFKGTMQSPTVTSIVTTSFGEIALNAQLTRSKATSDYNAAINIKEFQMGKLLKQEDVYGPVTLSAKVEGSGLTMEELNTKVNLRVASIIYQAYNYRDFRLDGTVNKYFFSGSAELPDENLNVKLKGDFDYNESVPKYKFSLELINADFKALNLSERPLKARGTLEVDLATSDFKVINGDFGIRKVAIFNGTDMYAVDSLLFASIDQKGQSEITLRSDIIDGNFKGTINLHSLPEVIRRHFNQYFSLQDTAFNRPAEPQDFNFDLTLKNTDLLTEILIPELDPFTPGEIRGEYDSKADKMDLKIGLTDMRYAGIGTDSIAFDLSSDPEGLVYALAIRKIQKDSLGIEALRLQGTVANDSIRTKLIVLDSLQKQKYVLGGVFYSLEDVFQFRFLEKEVIMNYAPWMAPADNSLRFTSRGVEAHNFSITNINETIALRTSNDADSITSILFKDLNIQNITRLVEGVTPVDGLANGDFTMMASKTGAFNSNLTIDKLTVFDHMWGDLSLALGQTTDGPLNIDVRLESDSTSLKAAGYYDADTLAPEINFVTEIVRLDLASMEPLAMGQLKNSKGQLTGKVSIKGDPKKPAIDGNLNFLNATFTPSMINTELMLEDETITIKDDQIIFSDFEIKDHEKNVATLKGEILSKEFKEFNLNLALNAKNFQVLNSTVKDNELFYGKVRITTQANVTGTLTQPVVDMNINLSDDSEFTYAIPQSDKGVLEQKGIVVFVDRDAKNDPFLNAIDPRDTIKSDFRGIDLSANIELNDKETFNIVIDPATGDKLSVKGNSTLTLDIDPTGDMVLTGRYEISEGSYDLSFYKFVKRKFLIDKGSTIVWAGSPTDATMDIRAIYEVETSPIDLMAGGGEGETPTTWKQRLPFLVYLQIKGELLEPEISFALDMPEDERNAIGGAVYAKIRDINTRESELNKQVFALLVLKRFIAENPLESGAGSDLESTARQSVSKLLTEQLNRLSQNVKGVELSFDVKSYEDYSSGSGQGQTELQLGLSKSLLDDRLIVKVAGNLEVEGEGQNSATDYIGDLALEYKLTEDGRFRITGFRNTNYDMISGEIIETGLGLIYIKDYNTLRELFKANAKNE